MKRWLDISEDERCDMVADYLHFAGTADSCDTDPGPITGNSIKAGQLYDDIEILTILERSWKGDPLWVVRAKRR